ASKVLAAELPGFVQLAGGTNHHTVAKLEAAGLLKSAAGTSRDAVGVAGVAYGSYARSRLLPLLNQLEQQSHEKQILPRLENCPDLLWQAVARASALVSPLKCREV
ncbi:MAG: LdpA C-terminal domain-containing domain, partial [Cyanobacteriota bacterium]|nr:LdpA C-terminal domain-containing domain [Cyanobacteriota bacterium]